MTNNKVAILITNYNMPERCDALCEHIQANVKWPHDLTVVDNGSDLAPPSQYTTLRLPVNVQTTGGWLAGVKVADILAQNQGEQHFAYCFLITSAEFISGDPLTPLAELLSGDPNAAGVHPALTEDSTTAWTHLKTRGGSSPRRTWMIDNIASLWRADFYRAHPFDPALKYGWGIDLELSWWERKEGRSLWIHEGAQVKKISNIGYTMGRMNMLSTTREILAGKNMHAVLSARYGPSWWDRMTKEFVTDEMV